MVQAALCELSESADSDNSTKAALTDAGWLPFDVGSARSSVNSNASSVAETPSRLRAMATRSSKKQFNNAKQPLVSIEAFRCHSEIRFFPSTSEPPVSFIEFSVGFQWVCECQRCSFIRADVFED